MMLMRVQSEDEEDAFDMISMDLFSSTTMSPIVPEITIDPTNWYQSLIDAVGMFGLIAIGSGIVLCFLCLCVGCCCLYRMRKGGSSSVYQYYSGIFNIFSFVNAKSHKYECTDIEV